MHSLRNLAFGCIFAAVVPFADRPALAAQEPSCKECDTARGEAARRERESRELDRARLAIEKLKLFLPTGGDLDTVKLRDLRAQLESALRELAVAHENRVMWREHEREARRQTARERQREISRVTRQATRTQAVNTGADGWIGVVLSAEAEVQKDEAGEETWKFSDYPTLVTVEPESPAERAGLEAGDVVLAFDGRDLRAKAVSMRKLLRPGVRLPVRFRRVGKTKNVSVLVERQPRGFRYGYRFTPGEFEIDMPDIDIELGEITVKVPTPAAAPRPRSPATPREAPGVAAAPTTLLPYRVTAMGLAGAELLPVDAQLGENFGVEHGLLVVSAGYETPASRAGLRRGDVILKADGKEITSLGQFQKAIEKCTDRSLELEIARKKDRLTKMLRW